MTPLGILASHGGSNLQAIIDACRDGGLRARVAVVIVNNRSALARERALRAGIPVEVLNGVTHPDPSALDRAIRDTLVRYAVEWVCLAGYMKKVGPLTLAAFPQRIVNIHPALLPKYGGPGFFGVNVHEAVIQAGETESGATVHQVDAVYDHGAILGQERVPILPGDTPETLAARILPVEHRLYVETLRRLLEGTRAP